MKRKDYRNKQDIKCVCGHDIDQHRLLRSSKPGACLAEVDYRYCECSMFKEA